jgi:hypothetical protein
MSPPLVPQLSHDLHFVLCDFGENGQAFVETDPDHADRNTIICNLISGQYDHPVRVIACNPSEGWAHDVSESIARSIVSGDVPLTAGTQTFVETALARSGVRE